MLRNSNTSGPANGGPPPPTTLTQIIFNRLRVAESFSISDLKQAYQGDLSDQQFGLVVHEVRERLRKELHIEFIVPRHGPPGLYVRANDVQKLNRSRQFSRTAKRKHVRAFDVVCAVNPDGLPDGKRAVIQRTQERLAREAIRSGLKTSSLPTSCDLPEIPRRDA